MRELMHSGVERHIHSTSTCGGILRGVRSGGHADEPAAVVKHATAAEFLG